VNRNKRSAAIDIMAPESRSLLASLVGKADVFVCNVRRVESLKKAGLDPETVQARNPRLVYCSITGYGRTGPYAGRGGYDLVAQGESGLMAATGDPSGEPMRWPVAIADMTTGVWSALGIVAALYARERTGRGQFLDQALLDGQLGWAPVLAGDYFATGSLPPRVGNRHATIVPYQVFRARDKHLIIAVGTQALWSRFCDVVGTGASLRDDPRFATNPDRIVNYAGLVPILERILVEEDAAHWLGKLRAAEIPCGPINALDEALSDPQVLHRGMVIELEHPVGVVRMLGSPLHLSGTPVTYRRRPPLLGEHTAEILAEAQAP
jgi:formyl-CoA transferase/CoA:oxalate CoA-transferase